MQHRYGLPVAFLGIGVVSILIGITVSQYAGAKLLRAEVGNDAARWATFLGGSLDRLEFITESGLISTEESRTLEKIAQAGGLTSFRIIGPDGRVMIASNPETIGRQIFAKGYDPRVRAGKTLASIERVDTAEGGRAVIGRATVPIMKGTTFFGVIEVSIDRTARATDHVWVTTGLTLFLGLLISAIAMVSLAYVQQRDTMRQAELDAVDGLRHLLEQQRIELVLKAEQLAERATASATVEPLPARMEQPPVADEPAMPNTQPRILLVESDPVSRRSAESVLNAIGYQVDVAADGLEAVAAVRRERYDAILMEYRLPVMDGVHASRLIRGMGGAAARTPIIAITAEATAESTMDEAEKLIAAGANGHVSKPFHTETLGRIIEQHRGASTAAAPAVPNEPTGTTSPMH